MIVPAIVVLVSLASSMAALPSASQSPRPADCTAWQQCRQLALDAAERHEYETFHDLAWRAIQTGKRNDPALMYLLARAQALSGRPHDALVMLQRLADMGVAVDAATNDDFKRARELPGWSDLAEQFERLQRPDAAPVATPTPAVSSPSRLPAVSPAPARTPPSPPAPRPAPEPPAAAPSPAPAAPSVARPPAPVASPVVAPVARPPVLAAAPVAEAMRFSTAPFAIAGLAYDAVSRRFLFGDRVGRKLFVVGEGSTQTTDLVHGDSAGFREISAIEIDARRGDLWVATAAAGGGAGTLHRLQLVSGRPLKTFPVDQPLESLTPVDLAVTPAGTVLVLDSASQQLFALRAGTTSLESIVRISEDDPISVAASDREGIAYVAYRDGVSKIDLRARTASHVALPKGTSLGRVERLRWYRNALIALTVESDDTRRIVRLELNGNGTAVARATTLEEAVPSGVQTFVTIAGDDLVYVESGSGASANLSELVVYRVRLR